MPIPGEAPAGERAAIFGDSPEYWSGSVKESESGRSSEVKLLFSGIESDLIDILYISYANRLITIHNNMGHNYLLY